MVTNILKNRITVDKVRAENVQLFEILQVFGYITKLDVAYSQRCQKQLVQVATIFGQFSYTVENLDVPTLKCQKNYKIIMINY